MTSEKSIERSVDTLQRVYAVIVALAINESIKRTFLKDASRDVEIHFDCLAQFIAFIFTAVPFLHGMNRHLDTTLNKINDQNRPRLFDILLVDFVVFLAESCVLFLLAASVSTSIFFFQLLLILLILDVFWTFVTWPITKSFLWQWATVNVIAIAAIAFVVFPIPMLPRRFTFQTSAQPYILMGVAIARTVLDYLSAWDFYFPSPGATPESTVAADTAEISK